MGDVSRFACDNVGMPGRITDKVKSQPPARWRWTRYAAAVIAAWMLACMVLPPLATSPRGASARRSSTSDELLFWDRAVRHHGDDRAWLAEMYGILVDPAAHLDWWVINGRLQVRIYGDGPNPIALELWIPGSKAEPRYPVLFDGDMPF